MRDRGCRAACQRRTTNGATGERQRFSSAISAPWRGRSPKGSEVLSLLYLQGLSSLVLGPASKVGVSEVSTVRNAAWE